MGFMGLKHWSEVDGASDLHYELNRAISDLVTDALSNEGNNYNPPGVINIALIFEENPDLFRFIPSRLAERVYRKLSHYNDSDWEAELRNDIRRLKKFWKRKL